MLTTCDPSKSAVALPPALHALAQELPTRRLARGVERLSEEVARGVSWESALAANTARLPPYLRGLLHAGIHSGRLPDALVRLVNMQRRSMQMRREIWLSLAYPTVLIVVLTVLFLLYELFFVRDIVQLYADFSIEASQAPVAIGRLPSLTQIMFYFSQPVPLIAVAVVPALAVLLACWRAAIHPRWLDAWFNRLPILGPLWHWTTVADSLRLTALLLEAEINLPRALGMTAAATPDGEVADGYWRLSRHVEAGQPLADSLKRSEAFPRSLVPMIAWGETYGELPAAMVAAAEMLEGRTRVQLAFVRTFVPPFVFLIVAGAIFCSVAAIFMPMLVLLDSLM